MSKIASGIYPVMITPFTADNQVDYEAVDQTMEFYARGGYQGVFAVCQSSEMFCLTEEERVKLAARVVKAAAGRMCVVASGHISDRMEDQIRELRRVSETGVDAVVMISNRLAGKDEPDEVLIQNMHRILDDIPGVTFGMYECPYPYKRLLTPKVLEAMAETGRFTFIKDTCCDADLIARRIALLHGRIQLFNANCATALETLQSGADGFSGIMANFHPDLLVWMYENYRQQPEKARQLSAMLSVMSMAEGCQHPIGAKYHMNLVGVPMELRCRVKNADCFDKMDRHTIEDLKTMEEVVRQWLKA